MCATPHKFAMQYHHARNPLKRVFSQTLFSNFFTVLPASSSHAGKISVPSAVNPPRERFVHFIVFYVLYVVTPCCRFATHRHQSILTVNVQQCLHVLAIRGFEFGLRGTEQRSARG